MAELSVAVIGCSGAGAVHLRCWSNLLGVRIAALCDPDSREVIRAARDYPGAAAFNDPVQMLASGPYDIVDVCSPPGQHFVQVGEALRLGSHVLCEKPLALAPSEAETLVALSHKYERHLMPAFFHRFHPPILFAKGLVENDDIGLVTMFRCRLSGYWSDAAAEMQDAERGNGALTETASQGIDLFRYFAGETASIQGKTRRVNPELKVEDTVALVLQSEKGALGVVEAAWTSPGGRSMVELYGTAGACLIDYDTGTMRYLTADHPVWQHHDEGGPNRFERAIAHFADVVRGLQVPLVTGSDGARAAALCAEVAERNPPWTDKT